MSSYQITIKDISNNEHLINVSFDFYGNLYFTLNNNTYQLNVDAKNTPYLDQDNYDIIDESTCKLHKFNNYESQYGTLSEKMQTIINDDTQNYYPEDNSYYMLDNHSNKNSDEDIIDEYIIDEDIEKQYGTFNKKFVFSHNNSIIPINMRNNGDICALYDTYIYNDANCLCFKSNSNDEISYYRIRLYNNGDIYFRPIGYSEKLYKLIITNSNELHIQ